MIRNFTDTVPCQYSTLYFTNTDAFRINSLVVGFVNILASVPTILLNFLVCVAFARKPSLRRNGNKVLFSLSVSDFLSGTLIQPMVSCMMIIGYVKHPIKIPCAIIHMASICGHTLACVSLLTVSFISLERYLAIFHPFVYNRRITSRFLYIVCAILWSISIVLVFTCIFLNLNIAFFWTNTIIIGFSYFWNIFVYIRIMAKVKRVQKEVNKMRQRFAGGGAGENHANTNEKQSKGTQVAGAIIISLLIAYLPQVIISIWRSFPYYERFIDYYLEYWSMTLALINPCLNPVFYCYYNSDIRKEVYSLLRLKYKENQNLSKIETGCTNMNYSQDNLPSVCDTNSEKGVVSVNDDV